ncbi:hypothetical protein [Bacillus anthracis]|uniref:hypothetical protein n=1 Tax=Bacillus anthracis TaxID=1392 RepID=UPI00099CF106|nr:hypothetical protein [Bacillus anthracis]OPD59427.1 hypothetical protein BVG01_07915 [Bacillus anthracis]
MTIAEMHGKIPEYEGMEDLLTSDVFSTFKYLPVDLAFIPFLKRAVSFETGETMSYFCDDIIKADFIFWPKTSFLKREPDLLILLTRLDKPPISIVVEAKYRSGKSNVNRDYDLSEMQLLEGDQLAEQYLELINGNFKINQLLKEKLMNSQKRFLLFVTAHNAIPKEMTNETMKILRNQGFREGNLKNLYWINWQAAWNIAREALSNNISMNYSYKLMLEDLKILLERKRLSSFNGFQKPICNEQLKEFYFWG